MQTGSEESMTYPASKMAKPVNGFTYRYTRANDACSALIYIISTVSDPSAVNLLSTNFLGATKSMKTELSVYKIEKGLKKGLSSNVNEQESKVTPSRDHLKTLECFSP